MADFKGGKVMAAGTHDFKAAYVELLATLYADIEGMLAEYGDGAARSPAAHRRTRAKLESLLARVAELKRGARSLPREEFGRSEHAFVVRSFLTEIQQLLDVEPDGDDWVEIFGGALMDAQNRIQEEAHWLSWAN
jgi:hypothetical protein